jgi:hypothetical protein
MSVQKSRYLKRTETPQNMHIFRDGAAGACGALAVLALPSEGAHCIAAANVLA